MQKSIMIGALALMTTSIACGDDPKPMDMCSGHGCFQGKNPFELNEGGEVRIIQTTFYDGMTPIAIDAQALFYKNQVPGKRSLAGTVIEGACEDWSSGDIFDNGPTPQTDAIVATREYVDVGPSLKITQGAKEFTLIAVTGDNAIDRANFVKHPRVYLSTTGQGEYAPTIQKADIQANAGVRVPVDLGEGKDPLGNDAPVDPELFIPADFTITSPVLSADVELPKTGDVTFTYGTSPSGSPNDITFIAFLDPTTFAAKGQCLAIPEEGARNPGTYVVPQTMVDRMGPTGALLVGTFVHRAYEYDGRRLDLLGINCHLFGWHRAP